MVAHVAAIEHLEVELAPTALVGLQLLGVELVIQKTAFAAYQVSVEVVRL